MQIREKEVGKGRSFLKPVSPLSLGTALIFSSVALAQNDITTEDAIRFLQQTSFGAKCGVRTPEGQCAPDSEVARVQTLGFDGWINDQFGAPSSGWATLPLMPADPAAGCGGDQACVRDNYRMYPVQKEFFAKALTQPDQLRQRVVFALDQIWVISAQLN